MKSRTSVSVLQRSISAISTAHEMMTMSDSSAASAVRMQKTRMSGWPIVSGLTTVKGPMVAVYVTAGDAGV